MSYDLFFLSGKLKKTVFVLTMLMFAVFPAFSQTKNLVKKLSEQYQDCLDSGWNMAGCAYTYDEELNKLLNKEFNLLKSRCNEAQKKNLTDEQIKWSLRTEKDVDKVEKEMIEKGGGYANDISALISAQHRADCTEKRLLEILERKPEDYSDEIYKKRSAKK